MTLSTALQTAQPSSETEDVDLQLTQAVAAQEQWAQYSLAQRSTVMTQVAACFRAAREELAASITADMGKPVTQALEEVDKASAAIAWYAEHAAEWLDPVETTIGPEAVIRFQPMGCILAIEPWNFPVWQLMRGGLGILFAGNGYVLKPAPAVLRTGALVKRLWEQGGLPVGLFTLLDISNEMTGRVIADERIAAVTLTGGGIAGRAVAEIAGRNLKKIVLELGGSDPFIVLADADVAAAAEAAVGARFNNSGQVCIAAKRFIVDAEVVDEFSRLFVARVQQLVVGDPSLPETEIGPLVSLAQRDGILAQVSASVSLGATVLCGGGIPNLPGAFLQPTVLANVTPGMPVFDEEVFGPVAPITVARGLEDAIALANATEFGLSASVWSGSPDSAQAVADRVHAGSVFINGAARSDVRIPIGGTRASGFGRELGAQGMHEFTHPQVLWTFASASHAKSKGNTP